MIKFPFVLGLFFLLATAILLAAGTSLVLPGTALDAIWLLRPDRRAALTAWRAGPAFLVLAVPMAAAAIGCFKRRPWARWLAIGILAVNGLGDAAQLAFGR